MSKFVKSGEFGGNVSYSCYFQGDARYVTESCGLLEKKSAKHVFRS